MNIHTDANGNMTGDASKNINAGNIKYDRRNLPYLIAGSRNHLINFGYDHTGNRVYKEKKESGVTASAQYYINDAGGKTIAVYDKDGNQLFVNLYGMDQIGKYARGSAAQKYFYLKDHLGNIRVTINSLGAVKGYDDYYPFGKTMDMRSNNTSNPNDNYKYSGKELDQEWIATDTPLDWYYFGARYYDPIIGRWMCVDPMAHKYPSLSSYVYCANNPMYFIDPNGMELQGDSTQLADLATDANNELEEAGVEDASVSVESRQEENSWLEQLVSDWFGDGSTTHTVFFLAANGSGWTNPSTGNAWKDKGVAWLGEMLNTETVFNYEISDNALGRVSLGNLSGNTVSMFPRQYFAREGLDFFAVFMHEFVGHGHPLSINSLKTSEQGANNIGDAFGNAGWHNHNAKNNNKPGGGYLGYPVILPKR